MSLRCSLIYGENLHIYRNLENDKVEATFRDDNGRHVGVTLCSWDEWKEVEIQDYRGQDYPDGSDNWLGFIGKIKQARAKAKEELEKFLNRTEDDNA